MTTAGNAAAESTTSLKGIAPKPRHSEGRTMKYRNLVLIGTSHIAVQSVRKIETAFIEHTPDIVAVELDPGRLHALLSGDRRKPGLSDIRRIGIKGYLFAMLGAWAEKKMGESVGVTPGEDMIRAVRLATEKRVPVALIDQNIEVTLREFSRHLTWKEKGRFVVDVIKAAVGPKKDAPFDLRTVPDAKTIRKLTGQVKKRYPHIYKVLVTDRNEFMAKRLANIMRIEQDKTILAVIGAGHEEEVMKIIKDSLKANPPARTTKKEDIGDKTKDLKSGKPEISHGRQ